MHLPKLCGNKFTIDLFMQVLYLCKGKGCCAKMHFCCVRVCLCCVNLKVFFCCVKVYLLLCKSVFLLCYRVYFCCYRVYFCCVRVYFCCLPDEDYHYEWSPVAQPEGSEETATMEGKNTDTLKLSHVSCPLQGAKH